MRNIRMALCLLAVFCTHAGCSQTGGVRPGSPSNMRTVASVGDKPLPSVSGEPGSSLRADADELDLPPSSGSRISGRVYDDRGKPVPNARVRLAVSGTPGGKAVYATTDRSGAFTLRGLRPGTSYAVIAEYQGEDGIVTGRTQAKAPQVDVRISLQPRGGESGQGHASIQPARPRVEPISNIDAVEDEGSGRRPFARQDQRRRPRPAAGQYRVGRASAEHAACREPVTTTGRRRFAAVGALAQVAPEQPGVPGPGRRNSREGTAPSASRSKVRDGAGTALDDDGPNPLPPALDTTEVSAREPADVLDERPVRWPAPRRDRRPAQGADRLLARLRRSTTRPLASWSLPASKSPVDARRRSCPARPSLRHRPLRLPWTRARMTTARRAVAPRFSPLGCTGRGPVDKSARRYRFIPPVGPEPAAIDGASNTDGRPTWAELARNQSEVPLDESIQRTAAEVPVSGDHGVVTLTGKTPPGRQGLARFLGGSRPPTDEAAEPAVCRFDPSKRKLVDFQLPGVDGKTGLDARHRRRRDSPRLLGKLVHPCRTSISHLTELQKTLGGKRLQVIGIACEKGATLQDRRASASKAMQELGINYPVLLSSKEGSCPLQQALQIQFYPTMILLDRDGKLLPRARGHRSHHEPHGSGDQHGPASDGGSAANDRVIR